jgi:NNP family nitrate/nitrite transporter-like MFS transporter
MPLFIAMFGGNTELAWRTVCVVPAAVAFVTGLVVYNDAPKGNYDELRLHGQFPNPQVTAWGSLKAGTWNRNSWMCVRPVWPA